MRLSDVRPPRPARGRAHALAGLTILVAAACGPSSGDGGLTIRLHAPPGTDAPVHVTGSFNDWDPGAADYRLEAEGDAWAIELPGVRGEVELKFTRGSWSTVEVDSAGADVPNRAVTVPDTGAVYEATVVRWRDPCDWPVAGSTATASVRLLDCAFPVPQLGRDRRVWVYLPPDYATSGRRYPVLYMHDGQNVFDAATSYSGEWGVDETLDSLHAAGDAGVIVVAVDNGQERRLDEYSPWSNPDQDAGGEGDEYVAFLVETLKPRVDSAYRTLPGREHTGIAGSSMGGLISLYAVLEYPEVFGRVGVFSPALWFAPAVFELARSALPLPAGTRIYVVTGGREGSTAYPRDHQRLVRLLEGAGGEGLAVEGRVVPEGTHSEQFWRQQFPAAYRWLFAP